MALGCSLAASNRSKKLWSPLSPSLSAPDWVRVGDRGALLSLTCCGCEASMCPLTSRRQLGGGALRGHVNRSSMLQRTQHTQDDNVSHFRARQERVRRLRYGNGYVWLRIGQYC